jgi:hypothetical protein
MATGLPSRGETLAASKEVARERTYYESSSEAVKVPMKRVSSKFQTSLMQTNWVLRCEWYLVRCYIMSTVG